MNTSFLQLDNDEEYMARMLKNSWEAKKEMRGNFATHSNRTYISPDTASLLETYRKNGVVEKGMERKRETTSNQYCICIANYHCSLKKSGPRFTGPDLPE